MRFYWQFCFEFVSACEFSERIVSPAPQNVIMIQKHELKF
jgi:hypothetical protein